jgi:Bacterial Ig-like domain (group 3)/Right handed beta helix region
MSRHLFSVHGSTRRASESARAHRHRRRWVLEQLDARLLLSGNPTCYTVNLTSDSGASSGTDVTTGDPSGDLLWAITQANNQGQPGYGPANSAGSVINFDPSVFATPQTIVLSSTLELSETDGPEMIQGPGSSLLTISGNNAVEVFLVDGGVTASISDLTITGGTASAGGGINNNGSLALSDSVISGNTATGDGGGNTSVAADGASSGGGIFNAYQATVINCVFANDEGYDGGGIWIGASLSVSGSTFKGNAVTDNGGGLYNQGTLSVSDDTVTGNTAANAGGGLFNLSGALTLSGGTISDNTANSAYGAGGGGIWNDATLSLAECTMTRNAAPANGGVGGGGIFNYSTGTLTVTGCTVADNMTSTEGGGLFNWGGAVVEGCTVAGNSAGGSGGGIDNMGSLTVCASSFTGSTARIGGGGISNSGAINVTGTSFSNDQVTSNGSGGGFGNSGTGTITDCTFTGNSISIGGFGGGLANGGSLTISGSTFGGNTDEYGAAISNGGTMTLSTSTVSGNSGSFGGGIINSGSLTVSACTVSGNTGGDGGGINQSGGTLELINSTVAGNSAGLGAGIYDSSPGLTVINSTIAYNSGYGVYNAGGAPTLDNTIVDWNYGPDAGGTAFNSASAYNLIGIDNTGSFSGNGNLVGVTNPGLGILANNGGPTQTIALLAGSRAINAGSTALALDQNGSPLTTDQRGAGFPRIVGGTVDIGAFEGPTVIGSPTVYTVDLTSASGTGSGNSGDLDYVINEVDANISPAGCIVQFDPSVFGTPQTITLSGTLQLSEPSGPLLISGPRAGLVTISGNNAVGVFQVDSGEVATLSGLTISGGSAGTGGGIFTQEFSTLGVIASTISGNFASGGGGGITNGGNLSLVDDTLSGDTVAQGNGGGLENAGSATVTGCLFTGDSAGGSGGGQEYGGGIENDGTLLVSSSAFTGDRAVGGGGGGIRNTGTITVMGTSFSDDQLENNNCCGSGGGFLNSNGSGTIAGSTFTGNSVDSGGFGGGLENGGSLTISGSTFSGNTDEYGAAISNGGTMTLSTSTVSGNSGDFGGGIINSGSLTVSACTVSGNTGGDGGGINQSGGTLVLINSTVAGNSASVGGGIYDSSPGLTVINTTVAYNGDHGFGSGIYNAGGAPTLDNTIVDWNYGSDAGGTPFASASAYNLIGIDTTGSFSGNLVGVTNPGLGILANNGGPTQTIALLAGSPAIDAGSSALAVDPTTGQPLIYDQRGVGYPRIVNGTVDIGAYEGPDPTTTSVTTSVTPSVYGQPVTFTATVIPTPPLSGTAITPAGTVTFYDGSTALGTGALNGLGVASYTTTAFQLIVGGNQSIKAVYGGDTNFNTSTSSVLTQAVSKDGTMTTSLASSTSPSVSGQTVTFTATVAANAPGSGTPTGIVTFYDNGAAIAAGTLAIVNGQDQATFSSSTLSTSSHSITAAYTSGDGNFNASPASAAITQVVNKASTSTAVVTSISPSVSGQAVTFTATLSIVSPGSTAVASPTGAVTFYNNGTEFGTGTLSVVGGQDEATFATNTLSTASHSITADYTSGDGNFSASPTSSAITQVVNKANTSATVATSVSPSVSGQTVTFTAAVSAASPGSTAVASPTGTVTFYNSGTAIGTGNLSVVNGQDQASLTTSTLSTATHSITAAYTIGDVNFNASLVSQAISQVVNKDSTSTIAGASPSSANLGQTVTFTATATANAPGSGTPTGTVDFYDTTTSTDLTPGGVALASGTAAFATTSLAAGPHTIKATYSGDGNFLTSFGIAGAITVGQSIIVLDPSAGGALSLSGNASVNLPGGVFVNSSSSSALSASGNAEIKATVIDVHGGVQKSGNASFSPAPSTGAAVAADPYASLAEPSASGLTNYGSESLSGNSSATIKPGVYSGISVSGNGTLTLNSGVFIIEGGGFSISGNASVSGTGVTVFNAGSKYPTTGGTYGSISLSGNGSYNLTPPTSGTYAGMVIFQSRDNTKALTISGNASGMIGTIYAPAAALTESGNAQLNASIDVDTLSISGNGVSNTIALSSPAGTVAYTPAQIRAAYGINSVADDGTGQTIAIVDAYDDPNIDQALDAFDAQFGLTSSGPTLYNEYGPAASFLTVLNQSGQTTALPSTDPAGPGNDNWEVEEALDVEWTHAIAPGAQIILVEANSQSLFDLMAGVGTAARQPGVSVVSMSWGFAEGQAVFAGDEAAYDSVFNVPGVTFVASTGDYGAADPEYPAFSPNVVAVGGTSLTLSGNGSYNSETGWGYQSASLGAFIGSGGGISLYEPEPAYQLGVQSTGMRTTPDVSLVADPATGAWIADPYNLDPSDPFEVVGGTSLAAPAWAGLVALVNQGRAAAGESNLNSSSPTDTQQALYMLPQTDYNVISGGSNGYTASASYNLVTGLGTPVANLLVPDLVAYQGPATPYAGPTVARLQNANLVNTGAGAGGTIDVFSVFDSLTVASVGVNRNGFVSAVDASVDRGLARSLPASERTAIPTVDWALEALQDEDVHETLIGDLAFEQVAKDPRKA